MATESSPAEQHAEKFRAAWGRLREQVGRVMVGQEAVVEGVMTALFGGGHVLLEGVPGLGKTLLVRSISQALSLEFSRIQFAPDLMPADITGTTVVHEDAASGERTFRFQKGPIFSQIVLADEINRATPKTQSAMLEAMQERSVSVGGTTYPMAEPFFVLATQNPIEQEGTYPLPEAQLDRFLFKLTVGYAGRRDLHTILDRTTRAEHPEVEPVLDGRTLLAFQKLVRQVMIAPEVQDYAIRCVLATHPGGPFATEAVTRRLRFGASPRAAQALVLGGKVRALRQGRGHVSIEDLQAMLLPALRHRVLLNFEAEADGFGADDIVRDLAAAVPVRAPETGEAGAGG